jgi:hypothetical protein
MKIETISISGDVEKRDRNWMIRIYSSLEQGDDVQIECHREVILVKDGKRWDMAGQYGERKYMISKSLSEIAYESITLPPEAGGITLTAGQVAMALEMLSNLFIEMAVNAISPKTCETGVEAFILTVNGSVFQSDAVILWNDKELKTTYVSVTQLTAEVPAEFVKEAGVAKIMVSSKLVKAQEMEFAVVKKEVAEPVV